MIFIICPLRLVAVSRYQDIKRSLGLSAAASLSSKITSPVLVSLYPKKFRVEIIGGQGD